MKSWSFIFAAATCVALAGCGGSDSGSGGKTGGGGTTDEVTVNLPTDSTGKGIGSVDFYYLTGAGRDINSLSGVLRRVYLDDGLSPQPEALVSDLKLQFAAYGSPTYVPVNVEFPSTTVRNFQDYTLDLDRLEYTEDVSGQVVSLSTINNIPYTFSGKADIAVYPGRRTGVSIFLDSSMFGTATGTSGSTVGTFDPDRFSAVNIPTSGLTNKIKGLFSDYMSFDISQIPDAQKPTLSDGTTKAARMFFSGDGYGLGDGELSGNYLALTTDKHTPIDGRFTAPSTLNGRAVPGTYSLVQSDPSSIDLNSTSKIISLVGIWKEHYQFLNNTGTTLLVSFPSTKDTNIQDVVYIKQSVATGAGGAKQYTISSLNWGYISYDFNTNTHAIKLYAAKDITSPVQSTTTLTGTLTGLVDANGTTARIAGEVRKASYTLSDGSTGKLVVFRK